MKEAMSFESFKKQERQAEDLKMAESEKQAEALKTERLAKQEGVLKTGKFGNQAEGLKKSAVENEVGNLKGAVIQVLSKKGHYKLAKDIDEGKISLGLHEQKFLNMGELAEKEAQKKGEEFDSTAYLVLRAEMIADELIKSSGSK